MFCGSAGIGGGGLKALAGTIVMRNVSVLRNAATDGGAFEVAKQEDPNGIPTVLVVEVAPLSIIQLSPASASRLAAYVWGIQGEE